MARTVSGVHAVPHPVSPGEERDRASAVGGHRLPEKVIAYGAAALFFLFGIWLTIEAIAQLT